MISITVHSIISSVLLCGPAAAWRASGMAGRLAARPDSLLSTSYRSRYTVNITCHNIIVYIVIYHSILNMPDEASSSRRAGLGRS